MADRFIRRTAVVRDGVIRVCGCVCVCPSAGVLSVCRQGIVSGGSVTGEDSVRIGVQPHGSADVATGAALSYESTVGSSLVAVYFFDGLSLQLALGTVRSTDFFCSSAYPYSSHE